MMPGTPRDIAEMTLMGLDTSLIAPAIVLFTRSWSGWRLLTWRAVVALPFFLVVHAAITAWMAVAMHAAALDVGVQIALVVVSVIFWLPVLASAAELSDAGRSVYLFLAMPSMDLAGVFVVLHGDSPGGLAMIVAMLPVGIAAVATTWRWMALEEASAAGSGLAVR